MVISIENQNGKTVLASATPITITKAIQTLKQKEKKNDLLTDSLNILYITKKDKNKIIIEKISQKTFAKTQNSNNLISPADYVNLQSMRSSTLAHKTKTTNKFGRDCCNLLNDLLLSDDEHQNDKKLIQESQKNDEIKIETNTSIIKNSTNNNEKFNSDINKIGKKLLEINLECEPKTIESSENINASVNNKTIKIEKKCENKKCDESILLERGPVRASKTSINYHPYSNIKTQQNNINTDSLLSTNTMYGSALHSSVYDTTAYSTNAYNYGFDCGIQTVIALNSSHCSDSRESTPDTITSEQSYAPTVNIQNNSIMINNQMPNANNDYLMQQNVVKNNINYDNLGKEFNDVYKNINDNELNVLLNSNNTHKKTEIPDSISDFILKYHPGYDFSHQNSSKNLFSNQINPENALFYKNNNIKIENSIESNSACNSPISAKTASNYSPSVPQKNEYINYSQQMGNKSNDKLTSKITNISPAISYKSTKTVRIAKEKLRNHINNKCLAEAIAWIYMNKNKEKSLYATDDDRDTLLHIVTTHVDHAKIYAIVEQLIKMEQESSENLLRHKFDLQNCYGKTPLMLAVEKNEYLIADYLLEAGACPNTQNTRSERNGPLHFAASHGFDKIVEILCSNALINTNLQNGIGLTPLLCAIKSHKTINEEIGIVINSTLIVETLLKNNADPMIADLTNGKTVIHYAIECLDRKLIEIFHKHLSEEKMTELVNKPDYCGNTPVNTLQQLLNAEESVRSKLYLTLITCGAIPPR